MGGGGDMEGDVESQKCEDFGGVGSVWKFHGICRREGCIRGVVSMKPLLLVILTIDFRRQCCKCNY